MDDTTTPQEVTTTETTQRPLPTVSALDAISASGADAALVEFDRDFKIYERADALTFLRTLFETYKIYSDLDERRARILALGVELDRGAATVDGCAARTEPVSKEATAS